MPVLISGILRDGAGNPVAGRTIQLKAKKTSPTVVVSTLSSSITGSDGSYRIEAEPGYYNVSILREGLLPVHVGEIYVAPTDTPDTLNAFLDAPKSGDLRPEVMKRFEEMLKQAVALCEGVEKDRLLAEAAATNAATSEQNAATSAGESAQSAEESAKSARLAGQHKDAAALSEQGAKTSEDAAAEYAEDAKGAAAGSLKTQNNLSEFAEADDKALAEIHKNLKLGTVAAKDMQSDVYDRTAGCVPLPGAFGFGAQLASKQVIAVGDEGQNNFQAHFNSKPPGRYLVRGLKNDYPISGMNFDGLVDVKWLSPSDASTARNVPKIAIFYGPRGAMYRSHCNGGYWSGWTDISPESAQRLTLQTMRTSEGANMPQVGGIVLAMVKNPGPNRTIIRRGDTYPGSWLLSVKLNGGNGEPVNCLYNQASTAYPGSYVAMFSGNDAPLEPGETLITLFMRVL